MKLDKDTIDKVRERLKEVGGTVSEAAQRGGISQQLASKILAGRNCEIETIEKFMSGYEAEVWHWEREIKRIKQLADA